MPVKRFTKLPSGDRVLDQVQDQLSTAISSHAATVDAHAKALTNGLTFTSNFNAEYVTVSITTPTTDWVVPTLNAGWTVFSGFTPQYRKDSAGVVWITGIVTAAAGGTAFTLPAGYRPAAQRDFATAGDTAGTEQYFRLRVTTGGNVDIAFGIPSTFGSIDCGFPCADSSPGVLSCFPVLVTPTKVTTPVAVQLVSVTDTSTSPTTVALGQLSWTIDAGGKLYITNLPGLLCGKTYSVKLLLVGG